MPIVRSTQYSTVTGTSQEFTTGMSPGVDYVISSTVGAYVRVGTTAGSASAGAGSFYLPANVMFHLKCDQSADGFVQIIREGASSGAATLAKLDKVF